VRTTANPGAMLIGTVANLWRYPVKSLRGEALQRARVLADGLENDRTAALLVETPTHARAGKPLRGKENNRLHLTADPETAASYAADDGAVVTLDRTLPRYFDARPVSVLLDRWVADVEALVGAALDPRRWRPNVFVRSATETVWRERDLVGGTLRAGDVALRVLQPITRCVTPNYDVETGEALPEVLDAVVRERDAKVGVYCEVLTPGTIALGDELALV